MNSLAALHWRIRLNGLFYAWWCMSCIILRLQQQTLPRS